MMSGEPERVAIVGSRDYPDLEAVRAYVRSLPPGTVVISGGARGVDQAAEEEARACGLPEPVVMRPQRPKPGLGKWAYTRAAYARNERIAMACDRMVAFWDGKSGGTKHVIGCARGLGKPVMVIQMGVKV